MQLEDYRRRWEKKSALRAIYRDLYRRMAEASVPGPGLEIGGGIGNLDLAEGELLRMDIQRSPGVHVVADAHRLPFSAGVFSNVYLFDVLHHLQCPHMFFSEAERILRPGGRVVMVEPGITPFSRLLYSMGHQEPVDMSWLPDKTCTPNPDKDPYDSNQAIPTILFKRFPRLLYRDVTMLRVVDVRWLSLVAYPLSGGFKSWSLIPEVWVKPVLRLEERLLPILGGLMAFRLLIVLENP
jgi:SAM-dependent methyltransferase